MYCAKYYDIFQPGIPPGSLSADIYILQSLYVTTLYKDRKCIFVENVWNKCSAKNIYYLATLPESFSDVFFFEGKH